jgi:tetratricopeptide (TPR) repeat protein
MIARQLIRRLLPAAVLAFTAAQTQAAGAQDGPPPLARQYLLAEQSFRAGDFTQAEQLYSKILEVHGDEPMAWFRIGLIQQRRRSFKAALNAYDSALACAPTVSSDEMARLLAKVRFNRALLLLDSAARDLKGIAPGALEQDLDATREALAAHVDAALLAADSSVTVDPPKALHGGTAPAKGYVYEVKQAVVMVGPVEEQHP